MYRIQILYKKILQFLATYQRLFGVTPKIYPNGYKVTETRLIVSGAKKRGRRLCVKTQVSCSQENRSQNSPQIKLRIQGSHGKA